VSILLLDGHCSFASSHDYDRMHDPKVLALKTKIEIHGQSDIPKRQASVEVTKTDGQIISQATKAVRGTPENRMTPDEVARKARDLMSPVLGEGRAEKCIETFLNLEDLENTEAFRSLLTVADVPLTSALKA
jgi:2-methylcitrate dehydratase PrpD